MEGSLEAVEICGDDDIRGITQPLGFISVYPLEGPFHDLYGMSLAFHSLPTSWPSG